MQAISTTSLLDSYMRGRGSCYKVEVAWDGTNYVDETDRVLNFDVTHEATARASGVAAIGASVADNATVTLRNGDGRYTPWGSGALAAYIASNAWLGLKAKLWMGYYTQAGVAEYVQVFAGHIANLTPQVRAGTVTLSLKDNSWRMLGAKVSSALYENKRVDQIITSLLTLISDAPSTSLDYGRYTIPFAWVHTENLWNELGLLAQAEGGRLYLSPTGVLVFENASHLLTGASHTASVATFSVSDYGDLVAPTERSDYYNKVIVSYAPYVTEQYQPIWECEDTEHMHVRAGESITFTADFDAPVYSLKALRKGIDYVAVTAGLLPRNDDVTITVTAKAQEAEITIENTSSHDLYLTQLRLIGRPIREGNRQRVEAVDASALSTQAGKRDMTIDSNCYIQTWAQAYTTANYALDRFKTPRSTWQVSNVAAMPWLELGDRVTVTEKAGASLGDGFVHRIRLSQPSRGGARMDLALLPESDLFRADDYFVLGTNTLGAASATPGKLWY